MDYLERNYKALFDFLARCESKFDNFAFPMKNNSSFDIIGIVGSYFYSIKIICTETKQPSGSYIANLLISGGHGDKKSKKTHFDNTKCHYLFVWTPEYKYLIPCKHIEQTRAITLSMFEQFIV